VTERERFCAVYDYQPVDRPPLHLVPPWPATLERWYGEGLPRYTDLNKYFEVTPFKLNNVSGKTGLWPPFERRRISEDAEYEVWIDETGRMVRQFRDPAHPSLPWGREFPLQSPADLRRLLDEHWQVDNLSERYPPEWEEQVRAAGTRDEVVLLDGGCYYWSLRQAAGVEAASYLFYDAPALVEELFERINYVCLEGLRRASALSKIDVIGYGEDVAFKNGPLVAPEMFRRLIVPRYRKIMDRAHELGIHMTWYDSDGDLRLLLPDLLEAGITLTAPCEVAAEMSAAELRRSFGRELRMAGAIDKREIAKGPAAIDAEIERNRGVIEEGGFFPAIDHSVPTDVSWTNYCHFVEKLRAVVGV
jgi:hypothetical protein